MAGRTRRTRKADQPTEAEVAEQGTENVQEGATEAPDTQQEADVTVTETEAPEAQVDAETEAAAEATPEAQDNAETEAASEAPAQNTEAPAESDGGAKKEQTPDELLQAFKDTVESTISEHADKSTGHVAEVPMAQVVAAYRTIPGTPKKGDATAWIADVMREALIEAQDMSRASALANINKALTEAKGRRAAAPSKPQVSPTEAYVNRLLVIAYANQFVPQPEGLDDNWQQQYQEKLEAEGPKVQAYKEWLAKPEDERGDEPEDVSQIAKDAAKMAQGRATGARKTGARRTGGGGGGGARRNVAKHVEEFLASVEPGSEHTVAQVANFKSSEYPEGEASPGAVAARLFPKDKPSTIEGFEAVMDGTTRKIRKI